MKARLALFSVAMTGSLASAWTADPAFSALAVLVAMFLCYCFGWYDKKVTA